MQVFQATPIISSWEITSTVENNLSRPSVLCLLTRSKIHRIFSCSEATINAPVSIVSMASTTNVSTIWFRQKKIQHQTMENILRCLQCHARLRTHRLKNSVHAWRYQSSAWESRANPEISQTSWSAWPRITLWSFVGRPWEGNVRLGLERKRS